MERLEEQRVAERLAEFSLRITVTLVGANENHQELSFAGASPKKHARRATPHETVHRMRSAVNDDQGFRGASR